MTASKSTLTFITESLPGLPVGQAQHVALQVDGGRPPYLFEITSGALPANLSLGNNGVITGTVAKATPDSTVFVKVTDSDGAHLTQAFDVQVT
jgi:Putative Ig domain